MIKDAEGQPISCATANAMALYDQAVRAFNLGYGDAARLFDAARGASLDSSTMTRHCTRSLPCF
jgi:hypothetical protein